MSKLIHTAEGELVEEDPFSVEGTIVHHHSYGSGVISKEALERQERLTKERSHDGFFNPDVSVNIEWDGTRKISYVAKSLLTVKNNG